MSKKTVLSAVVAAVAVTSMIAGGVPSVALAKHKTAAQIEAEREARQRRLEEDKAACEKEKKDSQNKGAIIGAVAGAVGGNVISGKKSKGAGTVAGAVVGGVVGAKMGKDKVKC